MIIAIAATGNSKESIIDGHFGRCRWFCFYDSVKDELTFSANDAAESHDRPGCAAATMVVSKGASVAVAGRFGARAAQILRDNSIQLVVPMTETRIKDIINKTKQKNMKIAVPTRGDIIDSHFGHCEMYTVFTVGEDGEITGSEIVPSPQGCGCKSDIAAVLQQMGVGVMLAGNMGTGALNVLSMHGIDVYRGCSGNVRTVAEMFLNGQIADSGEGCSHHDHHNHDGHVCNH